MPMSIDKFYSNIIIDKKQAKTLALMALSYDIDGFIDKHKLEYQRFLLDLENKQKGVEKNER